MHPVIALVTAGVEMDVSCANHGNADKVAFILDIIFRGQRGSFES